MAPPSAPRAPVRISKIGGRFLVFDIKDVAHLRRDHGVCAILTGVTPQAPTQNIFSGLPLELAAQEAGLLVKKGAALVEDDAAAHLSLLADPAAQRAYADCLRRQRQVLLAVAREASAEKQQLSAEARKQNAGKKQAKGKKGKGSAAPAGECPPVEEPSTESSSIEEPSTKSSNEDGAAANEQLELAFTPTTSAGLLRPPSTTTTCAAPVAGPLRAHFNARGYYMTPGLRFGSAYSVYPGDPFRYHAHFMASDYGWDDGIRLLDLVAIGRLATSVKKGFLIGVERPSAVMARRDSTETLMSRAGMSGPLPWSGRPCNSPRLQMLIPQLRYPRSFCVPKGINGAIIRSTEYTGTIKHACKKATECLLFSCTAHMYMCGVRQHTSCEREQGLNTPYPCSPPRSANASSPCSSCKT